ncbi:hypothetical protein RintRC_3226 [Richelia intracellularis]|nr:hypothetical protein RintRC_3226 [Richelia intracellularis]
MDCKATVNIGGYSRGGKTRGDNQGEAHDMGCKKNILPVGFLMKIVGNYSILTLVVQFL